MVKTLVAYFSAGGNTRKKAEIIADGLKADLYEIVPETPYTRADLNWMDKKSRSSIEMNEAGCRPRLADYSADIAAYDRIILGFPIWWYIAPKIINTFLEAYDFAGKQIVLFATSGGSSFGDTVRELSPSAPGAVITEGRIVNGRLSAQDARQIFE